METILNNLTTWGAEADRINRNFAKTQGVEVYYDLLAKAISDDDDLYGHEGHIYIKRGTGRTFLLFIYQSNKVGGESSAGGKSILKVFDYPSMILRRSINVFEAGVGSIPAAPYMLAPRVFCVGTTIRCFLGSQNGLNAIDISMVSDDPAEWTIGDSYVFSMTMLNSSGVPELLPVTPVNIQEHLEQYFGDTYAGYADSIPILRNFELPIANGGSLYTILELNGEFISHKESINWIIKSDDSGDTWDLTYPVNYTTSSRRSLLESSLVFIGNNIHIISRTSSAAIQHNISTDYGATWATAVNLLLSTIASKPSVINYYKHDDTLGIICAIQLTSEVVGTTGRTTLGIYTTTDLLTFTEIAKIVTPSFAHYPTLYYYSNRLLCVYTKGLKVYTGTTQYDRDTVVLARIV